MSAGGHFRYGSTADTGQPITDVRFAPESETDVSDGPPGLKDWLKRAHYVPALGFEAS